MTASRVTPPAVAAKAAKNRKAREDAAKRKKKPAPTGDVNKLRGGQRCSHPSLGNVTVLFHGVNTSYADVLLDDPSKVGYTSPIRVVRVEELTKLRGERRRIVRLTGDYPEAPAPAPK